MWRRIFARQWSAGAGAGSASAEGGSFFSRHIFVSDLTIASVLGIASGIVWRNWHFGNQEDVRDVYAHLDMVENQSRTELLDIMQKSADAREASYKQWLEHKRKNPGAGGDAGGAAGILTAGSADDKTPIYMTTTPPADAAQEKLQRLFKQTPNTEEDRLVAMYRHAKEHGDDPDNDPMLSLWRFQYPTATGEAPEFPPELLADAQRKLAATDKKAMAKIANGEIPPAKLPRLSPEVLARLPQDLRDRYNAPFIKPDKQDKKAEDPEGFSKEEKSFLRFWSFIKSQPTKPLTKEQEAKRKATAKKNEEEYKKLKEEFEGFGFLKPKEGASKADSKAAGKKAADNNNKADKKAADSEADKPTDSKARKAKSPKRKKDKANKTDKKKSDKKAEKAADKPDKADSKPDSKADSKAADSKTDNKADKKTDSKTDKPDNKADNKDKKANKA